MAKQEKEDKGSTKWGKSGDGYDAKDGQGMKCPTCAGVGYVFRKRQGVVLSDANEGMSDDERKTCGECKGSGRI